MDNPSSPFTPVMNSKDSIFRLTAGKKHLVSSATKCYFVFMDNLATISAHISTMNQSLSSISSSLSTIAKDANDPVTKYITIISVGVAAFAAWQSRIAAQSAAQAQRNEVQPVLKNAMFDHDVKTETIIFRVTCGGKGSLYNLWLEKPIRKKLVEFLGVNAETPDERIPYILKGKVVFSYEDVYGNKFESYANIENNSFDGNYKQKRK